MDIKDGQILAQLQRLKLSTSVSRSRWREEANHGHETAQRKTRKIRSLGFEDSGA